MPEEPDIKIKDYQIHLPPLGEGTYGRVYRATYRGISERALKIFRPGAVDLSAMARELEKLSSVAEHRGIVTLHDFDVLNEPPYYAMGLHADQTADGTWETRTLERLCGKLDHRIAWRLIRDIAEALAYLHRHQIIHCDVKPSNILLTDETPYRIKICDFGQSRGNAAEEFKAVGTPLYASPEQLRNPRESSDGIGFRWDVYSFGVVAYKLLTGILPRLQPLADAERKSFDPDATLTEASLEATIADGSTSIDGEQLATMTEAVETIEWPAGFHIPNERKELIEQCLSLNPRDRPADMREVLNRIQHLDQIQVVRRARRLNAIFATLLVVAIWASGFAFIQARKAKESSNDAEELALIVVNELNRRDFADPEMDELYATIATHSETFLQNLPVDHRKSDKILRLSAQTSSMRGRQAMERGELDEALTRFKSAYDIRSRLAATNSSPGTDHALLASRDLMEIGKVHELQGDYTEAATSFVEALKWLNQTVEKSGNPTLQRLRELASVYQSLARVSELQKKYKDAITYLNQILTKFDAILEEADPTDQPSIRRQTIHLLENLGRIQLETKDPVSAENTYQELLARAESLETAAPSYREEARQVYMDAISALGKIQLNQDQDEAALVLFKKEITLRKNASDARPYDPNLRLALADAYAMASTCLDPEDPSSRSLAKYYLQRAVSLISRLPPDLRKEENTQAKVIAYNDLLSNLLEMDE